MSTGNIVPRTPRVNAGIRDNLRSEHDGPRRDRSRRGPRGQNEAADRAWVARDPPRVPLARRGYLVRITIRAYGLVGGTPPESAVTWANPLAGTPKRAYAVPPPRE